MREILLHGPIDGTLSTLRKNMVRKKKKSKHNITASQRSKVVTILALYSPGLVLAAAIYSICRSASPQTGES